MPTEKITENSCIGAPGLAINGAGNATVKYGNTFRIKANGRLSTSITTAAVSTATFVAATIVSPLPSGSATVPTTLATGYRRTYAVVATLTTTAGTMITAPTFSVICGSDVAIGTEMPSTGEFVYPSQSNQVVVGWFVVQNQSGSNFTPGTTALDATGINVVYVDNYGVIGS